MGKTIAIVVAGFVALVIGLTALGFALDWFGTGVKIVSPENVKAQYEFAYQDTRALRADATNVCGELHVLADPTVSADEKTSRRSQLLAYQQLYAKTEADYDARVANVFQAKLVKPSDVPLVSPTLQEMEATLPVCAGLITPAS